MKHKKHKFIMVIQTLSSVHSTHPHMCASQSGYNNSLYKQVYMYIVVLDLMEFILHMINYGHDLNSNSMVEIAINIIAFVMLFHDYKYI